MPIFDDISIAGNDVKHQGLLRRLNHIFDEAYSPNSTMWIEGDRDTRVYAGDTSIYADIYSSAMLARRSNYSFNRVKRVVHNIEGKQRQDRKSLVVTPVENANMETADQMTKVIFHINNNDSIPETFSEACKGSLITGLNLLQIYVDYRHDPVSGTIRCDRLAYNSYIIDPFFRKYDLSDCRYLWVRRYLSEEEVISLLPEQSDIIQSLPLKDTQDGRFNYLPEMYNMHARLYTYDEYYYKTFRKQKMLIDTQTGECKEWLYPSQEEQLQRFLRAYPQITVVEQEVPTIKLAIIVNDKVLYDGGNPSGLDEYPFVPVFCYFTPELQDFGMRIQGVVRGLRDAQYLYNQRRAIEEDILRSTVNSGFIYKESALVNPKDIFMTGQGKGIALTDEASMSDVVQIPTPAIHPSLFQVSENYSKEMNEITGLSEENLAASSEDIAGVLAMLRQGAGLIGLQGIFDGWNRALKLLGRKELLLMQNNYTPGKIQNILTGEKPMPQFYQKEFGVYDVVVEEGLNTTTQKQMHLAQVLQLREAGVPVPDEYLLDAVTLQDKKKLIESVVAKQEEAAKQQQQQMEIEMFKLKAEAEMAQAKANSDNAWAIERTARVEQEESMAIEKRAEAVNQRNQAVLNMIKAIKEIDAGDLAHLETMIRMQQMVKMQESEVAGEVQQNSPDKSKSIAKPKSTKTQVSTTQVSKPVKTTKSKLANKQKLV